jgi:hypothetical protein
MLPPILLTIVIAGACAIGAYQYWKMGNWERYEKDKGFAIFCAVIAGLFIWFALSTNNPKVWWGSGCPMPNYMAGMCPPFHKMQQPPNLK